MDPIAQPSGPSLMRTPKGMRLHIGLFGRRNVGKSSILNAITHQRTAIISEVAGTTTDPVDKPMELLPLGPVLFIDTAGIDDTQETIGKLRTERTQKVFERCDVGIIATERGQWGTYEEFLAQQLAKRNIPYLIVFNKVDELPEDTDPSSEARHSAEALLATLRQKLPEQLREVPACCMSAKDGKGVLALRALLLEQAPASFIESPKILGDLVDPGSVVVLVIPIDKEAPKGRIILPQVQAIRDLLDSRCIPMCTTDEDLPRTLASLKEPPGLVVTDSQAFKKVAAIVPESVPLTGFSVAFARLKGNLPLQAQGTLAIDALNEHSRVLIAEACTHHPIEEDIGTVKLPKLLRSRVGEGLAIDHVRGVDFPANLSPYDLVIHCGACTFNRRAVLSRIQACAEAGVPISNYGLALAHLNGIFERAIQPFGITQNHS